jgi:type I restriction enzyme M protein
MRPALDTVANWIWEAFDPVRSLMSPSEAYPYLLGIIGLKRFSDQGGDDVVRWHELAPEQYDLGSALNAALARVEAACPEYRGWFSDLDYNHRTLGGHQAWNRLWQSAVTAVGEFNFAALLEEDPQAIHDLCIKLNELVSRASSAKGEFETPDCLATLMSVLLAPHNGQSVYDPFCSSGTTLLRVASRTRDHDPDAHLALYAETRFLEAARKTHLNLFAAGERGAHVASGDIIARPGFTDGRQVKTFDRILCTIPFGAKSWGEEIATYDPFGRFVYGIPPATQGDFAYLQHCIASLPDDGVLVAVVSPSLLFKERREGDIRRRIVEADLVEAVIRLPPKLLLQTSIPVALLVIRRTKPESRKDKVLFVNASKGFLPGRSQNTLRNEDVAAIEKAYNAFGEIEGYSAVCSIKTIAEHGFSLDVSEYVIEVSDLEVTLDLEGALRELDKLHQRRAGQYEEMRATLARLMKHMEAE